MPVVVEPARMPASDIRLPKADKCVLVIFGALAFLAPFVQGGWGGLLFIALLRVLSEGRGRQHKRGGSRKRKRSFHIQVS